ncbi:MAG TPA: holo-ACP synthase [Firmicutes bacterium]|nr:holo-ACP synthase [Bacillota bacterium]
MVVAVGVDLTEVDRIAYLAERYGTRFLGRIFTAAEQELCGGDSRRLAGRFAAKEAVMKALGTGWALGVGWQDIHIGNREGGAPVVHLTGKAAEVAAARGISRWHLSLSHTATAAIAMVVAEGEDGFCGWSPDKK